MSILNVVKLSHGFGDRAIFTDVSFRLLKGEHVGFVGANGEGKSTFMNIITGKLMPDEGKIEWSKNVRVGYLDQHTVLEQGQTIRDVLQSAFALVARGEVISIFSGVDAVTEQRPSARSSAQTCFRKSISRKIRLIFSKMAWLFCIFSQKFSTGVRLFRI